MEIQSLENQAKTIVMEKFIKLIDKYPDKDWDWTFISRNPNITIEIINKYHDKPWEWDEISSHPNIKMSIIENNPDKTWDW